MPIGLPGTDRLPDGPMRVFVVELHALYGLAGRPAARAISRRVFADRTLQSVSHETVSSLLRGASLPAWAKVESIIVVLNRMAVQQSDPQQLRIRFNRLWLDVDHPPRGPATEPRPEAWSEPPPALERPLPAPEERIHSGRPPLSPFFTGREIMLAAMARRQADNPDAPLLLHGPLGCGKTQLALAYVEHHAQEYAVVWWVDAADVAGARTSLFELAGVLGVPRGPDGRQTLADLFTRLESASLSYLLIFDGAESADIRTLIRTVGGNVIVTTRNTGWAKDSANIGLEVPDLDRGEAVQFLRKHDVHLDIAQADRLIARTGRAPLALEQVNAMYAVMAMRWEDLTDLLAAPGSGVLAAAAAPPGQYRQTVVEAVREALDRLTALDAPAVSLLHLLAGFGPEAVSMPMLLAGAGGRVSAELRRILVDQIELRKKLPLIVRCGLARLDAEGQRIEVPPIVRLALRELLPEELREQVRTDVLEILTAADPGHPDDPRTWAMHRAIAPHLRPAGLIEWHRLPAYRTIRHQIRFLFLTGRHAAAQRLGAEAEAAWTEPEGPDTDGRLAPGDELVLQIKREWANALRAAGRYGDAERLTAALMTRVRADGAYSDDHSVALDLARSRGHDLRIAGLYAQAYELDQATYARHVRKYEDENDDRTVASRYNLGISLRFVGRFAEAEAGDRIEYGRLRRRVDSGDRRALRTVNGLAEDLYGLGRYREALELLAPLLEMKPSGAVAGRSLLRARRTAALARRRLGEVAAAVEQLGAAYHACVAALGGEDRELTLATAMSYANALRELGQPETALHYALRAVDGYQRAMGDQNPLVHAARANAAAALRALRRPGGEAVSMARDAHDELVRRLGDRHPFAVAAAVDLATALSTTGDLAGARHLSARAYENARATFGENHPDTLVAAANFAADRAALFEPDGGWPTLDDVLGRWRRMLGPDHPLIARVAGGARAEADIEPPSA